MFLHMTEMIRNAVACGSDLYRRVELKVRKTDSPFLLQKGGLGRQKRTRDIFTSWYRWRTLAFPSSSGSEFGKISDWKTSKQDQLTHKLRCLSYSKLAIETDIREHAR